MVHKKGKVVDFGQPNYTEIVLIFVDSFRRTKSIFALYVGDVKN